MTLRWGVWGGVCGGDAQGHSHHVCWLWRLSGQRHWLGKGGDSNLDPSYSIYLIFVFLGK